MHARLTSRAAIILAFAHAALSAQAQTQVRSPWTGATWVEYMPSQIPVLQTGPVRAAVDSADMVGKSFPYRIARRTIAGRRFVLLEGWSGEGTGWAQLTYWLYEARPDSSVRLRWRAVASEHSYPWPSALAREYPPYELRSCLLLAGTDGIGYAVTGLPRLDRGNDPPAPRSGYYAWSEAESTFTYRARPDAAFESACRRVRHGVRYTP
jgi:hypothetical protein